MPQFNYTARTREGETISATIEAQTKEAAGQMIRNQGMLPTKIESKDSKRISFGSLRMILGRVSMLEKLTFIKNLAVTLRAGLPVSRALSVLTKQMTSPYFRKAIASISANVESGKSLADSMAEFPGIFSPIFISMVRVGEQTGELEKNLDYLGTQISRDYDLIRRTKGAMTYPAVVVIALFIIGYLMFTFVLPKLTETFKEFNVTLPLLTVIIVKTVDVFSKYSILILLFIIALVVAFWIWHKTQSGTIVLHKVMLTTPVLGTVVKKLNLARFTMIFSGLLRSGMPIVEALKIVSDTMTNIYYKKALAEASDKVKVGVDLVAALDKYPKLFTPMVNQMIAVGEESGTMEKVLAEVSNFYESEIDETVKNLSSIIEPVLVIVIGAVVGVLAVGLILPIYNIGQNI